MNYIKKYESYSENSESIKDIFFDIIDDGIQVSVSDRKILVNGVKVEKPKTKGKFDIDTTFDTKDVVVVSINKKSISDESHFIQRIEEVKKRMEMMGITYSIINDSLTSVFNFFIYT